MSTPATPAKKKRFPLVLVFVFGLLFTCGVFGTIQYRRYTCADRPESMRNPPIPSGAEQIAAGTPNFTPFEYYEAREIHFETTAKPEEVYNFYKEALDRDGWSNDGAYAGYMELPPGVLLLPGSAKATFYWQCRTGLSPGGISAILWFYSQVLASGKSRVTLNYEYQPW